MIVILKDCGEHGLLACGVDGEELKFKDQAEAQDFLIEKGVPVQELDTFIYEDEGR